MRVDLPAPLSPMTASTSPGYRSMSTPSSPTTRPNVLTSPRAQDRHAGVDRLPAVRAARWDAGHAFTLRIHWSTATARMTSTPTARTRYWSSTPARDRPLRKKPTIERAEQGAEHGAPAAEEAGAADDDGGDALQVGVGDRVRAGGAGPADEDPGGEAVDRAGDDVDAEQDPVDADAGQPRGLRVVADGVHVPAPGGLAQGEADDDVQDGDEHHAGGDAEPADRERRPRSSSAAPAGRRPARSGPWSRAAPTAVKTLSVPSVTMNGGSPIRVTSTPLSSAGGDPDGDPDQQREEPGHARCPRASLAITIIARIVTAPTDRSMPAVRMIRVCPTARAPMTATCCRTSDSEFGWAKRGLISEKTDEGEDQHQDGLMAGYECSTCWTRCTGELRRRSANCSAAVVAASR